MRFCSHKNISRRRLQRQHDTAAEWLLFMVSAGDFRNGVTFEMDGNVYQIIEFQHVKPGKGAAFVRTKLRNVLAGSVEIGRAHV